MATAGVDVGSTQTKAVVIDEEPRIVGRALIDDRRQRHGAPPRRRSAWRSQDAGDERGRGRVRRRHRLRPLQGDVRQHAGHRDQLPRPRRGAPVPGNTHACSTWAARTPRRSGSATHGRDPRLLHERQVRGRHRPLPRRRLAGARDPARRARAARAARRAPGARSAPPARCSPSPRSSAGSARARRSRTSCSACTSRSPRAHRAPAARRHRAARSPSPAASRATSAMVELLEELPATPINVSEESHYMGALGAALFALDRILAETSATASGGIDAMTLTAGIDVGSTYTKAVVADEEGAVAARDLEPDRVQPRRAAEAALEQRARGRRGRARRHQLRGGDRLRPPHGPVPRPRVTDLTATPAATTTSSPRTRTVLDVGGQTMKASRLDETGRVKASA